MRQRQHTQMIISDFYAQHEHARQFCDLSHHFLGVQMIRWALDAVRQWWRLNAF